MIIGITGNSGSGKTTISNILSQKLEYYLINADKIAKELAKKGNEYYNKIVQNFGKEILDNKEEIIRSKLASIVYNNNEKMETLNNLTNEYIVSEIKKQALEKENAIIDVPRLIECGLSKICDVVISVLAEENIKIERICTRDGVSQSVARARLNIQAKDEFYIQNSDYIIENNGQNIDKEVESIIKNIK